jgi:hypothetical protein
MAKGKASITFCPFYTGDSNRGRESFETRGVVDRNGLTAGVVLAADNHAALAQRCRRIFSLF